MNPWDLPSGQEFIRQIAGVLREGRNCAAIIPDGLLGSDMTGHLSRCLYNAGSGVCLEKIGPPNKPLGILIQELINEQASGSEVRSDCDFEQLLQTEIPASFVVITLSYSDSVQAQATADTLLDLSNSYKRFKDRGRTPEWTLLVLSPPVRPLPNSEVFLEVLPWWGRRRRTDLEFAFDFCLKELRLPDEALAWWIYSLGQGLAVTDPWLFWELFNRMPTTKDEIFSMLGNLPATQSAAQTDVHLIIEADRKSYSSPRLIDPAASPKTDQEFELWRRGLLDVDWMGKSVVHPGALLAAKRTLSLERLICRGQQQVFTALVHDVLGYIRAKFTESFGDDWHKKGPLEDWDDILNDIGPLSKYITIYLRTCPPALREMAFAWCDCRHTVAHNKFLSFDKFKKAMELHRQKN